MKKLLMSAAALALAVGISTSTASAADKLKACWIYVGAIGDFGWTHQHNEGRLAVEKELGDKVQTIFVENVAEADSERAIERLARDGCAIIFTTSFGFMEPTLKVAKKFPKVDFEHATGYKRAKNVATYSGRFYEGRYVMGQIAAKMSKSGIIGYVASYPIPEVISGINAFMLGAQSVKPDMKVKIVWVNSWYDPGKEADAANALVAQGADILTQHTDSPAAMQVAEAKGIHAFGQDSDMIKFGPKAQLTANVEDWGNYYIERAKLKLDGKWTSTDTWDGMKEGMVVMAPFTNMPDDVKKMAEDTVAAIKAGTLHPFKCPVTDQSGKEVECKGGTHLADDQILGMNWYIKGIDEKVPQ